MNISLKHLKPAMNIILRPTNLCPGFHEGLLYPVVKYNNKNYIMFDETTEEQRQNGDIVYSGAYFSDFITNYGNEYIVETSEFIKQNIDV